MVKVPECPQYDLDLSAHSMIWIWVLTDWSKSECSHLYEQFRSPSLSVFACVCVCVCVCLCACVCVCVPVCVQGVSDPWELGS